MILYVIGAIVYLVLIIEIYSRYKPFLEHYYTNSKDISLETLISFGSVFLAGVIWDCIDIHPIGVINNLLIAAATIFIWFRIVKYQLKG